MPTAIILVQAAADLPPIAFDLGKVSSGSRCGPGSGSGIIVCARRRHEPIAEPLATGPYTTSLLPKADVGLFGTVRGSLHGEQETIGGIPSNAAKLTITMPF